MLKRISIIQDISSLKTSKIDIFLKDLNSELHLLIYKDNIEEFYHNFTTMLSISINKFSFEVSYKENKRTTNSWYD